MVKLLCLLVEIIKSQPQEQQKRRRSQQGFWRVIQRTEFGCHAHTAKQTITIENSGKENEMVTILIGWQSSRHLHHNRRQVRLKPVDQRIVIIE